MHPVRLVHTAHLDPDSRRAAYAFLAQAFAGDFTDDDWEHALGGFHALVHAGPRLIGHASVVQRRLLHQGRALRAGYVEGVAVHAEHRRHGVAGAMMAALESVVRAAYDLGALGASADGARLYTARGWQRWRGPTSALTPTGLRRTPDDDGDVFVLPGDARLDLDAELSCDWRQGDLW